MMSGREEGSGDKTRVGVGVCVGSGMCVLGKRYACVCDVNFHEHRMYFLLVCIYCS